ncbi:MULTISPECIES: hypothetical protein [unclassified Colwellia]|uniref:hypothetical protein n=1 Tax=unclassified Colwellia TaxID=196834 RepID=UPI0015F55A8F|nr:MULTISPECIES: hypothetical protein [unclassified Colwellia]MBA6225402.1 hypothetical protein [Colwellia sp. MB3u-45]MBA6266620.1 hypothetical protein [Colwellia sp. MB3u-43]MBA6287561.1 hypothetical protein [Colwellia sp. MB3u-4]MBA6294495.1 hypothetical protein [Colwellia sp. MB02u-9]MBA6320731.1 hypothetical protein [Colwellia sp. MB02u-19]
MPFSITPELFNYIAITFARFKWQLLAWSLFFFVLYIALQSQIQLKTPSVLVWLAILILFVAIESLVVSAFMFFFQVLPSTREENAAWFKFYRTIEWCETILFAILLPLPIVLFIYTFLRLAI